MKSMLLQQLALCAAALVASPTDFDQQVHLVDSNVMAKPVKVPGHSDAIYGPVPEGDKLLKIEFLEIAPTPINSYASS